MGIGDSTSIAAQQGLIDQSSFARASQAISIACQSLLNPSSNQQQVRFQLRIYPNRSYFYKVPIAFVPGPCRCYCHCETHQCVVQCLQNCFPAYIQPGGKEALCHGSQRSGQQHCQLGEEHQGFGRATHP